MSSVSTYSPVIELCGAVLAADAFGDSWAVVIGLADKAEVVVPIVVHERAFDVRLAEKGGFVSGFLKQIGDEREASGYVALDVGNGAGGVRIHAGQARLRARAGRAH